MICYTKICRLIFTSNYNLMSVWFHINWSRLFLTQKTRRKDFPPALLQTSITLCNYLFTRKYVAHTYLLSHWIKDISNFRIGTLNYLKVCNFHRFKTTHLLTYDCKYNVVMYKNIPKHIKLSWKMLFLAIWLDWLGSCDKSEKQGKLAFKKLL